MAVRNDALQRGTPTNRGSALNPRQQRRSAPVHSSGWLSAAVVDLPYRSPGTPLTEAVEQRRTGEHSDRQGQCNKDPAGQQRWQSARQENCRTGSPSDSTITPAMNSGWPRAARPASARTRSRSSAGTLSSSAVTGAGRFMAGGERRITDDNLWRPTRRARGHCTKDKPPTRRGAVHSIGWLSGPGGRPDSVDTRNKSDGGKPDDEHDVTQAVDATVSGEVGRKLDERAEPADQPPNWPRQTPPPRWRGVTAVLDGWRSWVHGRVAEGRMTVVLPHPCGISRSRTARCRRRARDASRRTAGVQPVAGTRACRGDRRKQFE